MKLVVKSAKRIWHLDSDKQIIRKSRLVLPNGCTNNFVEAAVITFILVYVCIIAPGKLIYAIHYVMITTLTIIIIEQYYSRLCFKDICNP